MYKPIAKRNKPASGARYNHDARLRRSEGASKVGHLGDVAIGSVPYDNGYGSSKNGVRKK